MSEPPLRLDLILDAISACAERHAPAHWLPLVFLFDPETGHVTGGAPDSLDRATIIAALRAWCDWEAQRLADGDDDDSYLSS